MTSVLERLDQEPAVAPTLLASGGAGKQRLLLQAALERALDTVGTCIPEATLLMLMRAESRTTVAILRARGAFQTKQVIVAALRRAHLEDLARTLEKTADVAHMQDSDVCPIEITQPTQLQHPPQPQALNLEQMIPTAAPCQFQPLEQMQSILNVAAATHSCVTQLMARFDSSTGLLHQIAKTLKVQEPVIESSVDASRQLRMDFEDLVARTQRLEAWAIDVCKELAKKEANLRDTVSQTSDSEENGTKDGDAAAATVPLKSTCVEIVSSDEEENTETEEDKTVAQVACWSHQAERAVVCATCQFVEGEGHLAVGSSRQRMMMLGILHRACHPPRPLLRTPTLIRLPFQVL
eukprot:1000308-Amphidinium_carterae.2